MLIVASPAANHNTLGNMPGQIFVRNRLGASGERRKAGQSGSCVGGFVGCVCIKRLADNAIDIFGRQTVESLTAQRRFDRGQPVRFGMGGKARTHRYFSHRLVLPGPECAPILGKSQGSPKGRSR